MADTVAIIGANVAGGSAAFALRDSGFDGRIVLLGAEEHLPYERPPLSKNVLLGTAVPADVELWPAAEYESAEIEVELGVRATALRLGEGSVELDTGAVLPVDKVLLATGSRPRALTGVPGGELAVLLRDLDDALALRERLVPGARIVIVGAGFIGAEVAAAARAHGCEVTVLEVAPLPLQRVLGPEFGRMYTELHRAHEVDVRLGVRIAEIAEHNVVLEGGIAFPADTVVAGIGAEPATELAEAAGILVRDGVVVDAQGRTSVANVFAAGDVATRPSSFVDGPTARLESWQNAQNQAAAVAGAIAGADVAYDEVPWFWSDQYDVNLQLAGSPARGTEVVWRGDREGLRCAAYYCAGGVVQGVVGMNAGRDVRGGMELIARRTAVEAAALADPAVDLRALARKGAGRG